jgi:mRNA interferase RelE/StbE
MTLIIPPLIFKQVKQMPQADRDRILQALRQVAADPSARPGFTTEMVGQPGVWRLRKGDWRAIFILEGEDVVVLRIGNRRDIYR